MQPSGIFIMPAQQWLRRFPAHALRPAATAPDSGRNAKGRLLPSKRPCFTS